MSKTSKITRSWDCTESCRLENHANRLFTAVSRRTESDQQVACYLIRTCRNFSKISDGLGKTVLHIAAACGRKNLCIWLITKADSNVNAPDLESGYTPLHAALFYGHIDVAVKLIELGAKLSLLDREHLSPISLLSLDLAPIVPLSSARTEAYVCGTNLNYTLGIGTDDSKKVPEVLEFFRRSALSIKQVCMEEFHTVFVTSCHQVYVCGHGQGGRLGIGKEKPLLIPTQLPTRGESCVQAAIGLNHTLLLLANGGVLSCGSNIHHQLGISPYVEQSSTPRYVNTNATRASGKIFAICASKYNSVFCTKKAVFACGLNAGQLGPRDNHMDFFTVPQQLAAVVRETDYITLVTASLGSVSYATSHGDIFTIQQFQHKKVMRCPGIVKLDSQGGRLAPVVNGLESGEELKLVWLTEKGSIYVWQEKRGVSICSIGNGRILSICDISLRDDTLRFVTKYGEAFSGFLKTKDAGGIPEKIGKNSDQNIPCWCNVNIKQIPNVYRALSITSDPKGKNIALIQAHPANPVGFSFTSTRPSTFTSQLSNFLQQTTENDDLHNIVFSVERTKFAAHKYILISRGWTSNILKLGHVQVPSSIPPNIFKELLGYVYTGESVLLRVGKCDDSFLETGDPIKKFTEAALFAGLEDLCKTLQIFRFESGTIYSVKELDSFLPTSRIQFDRSSFPSLCDVIVKCDDSSELKAHKCILAARMEYFNNMFSRGWTEAAADRKIHLQCSSKIAGWILDFLYTDKLPISFSCDDLDNIIKLMIASDQYLIDDLKDECAIYLSEMLSLKNCTMILQLANTYNEYRLKMSVMEYIAYNLNAMIENRYLELLDDSLLFELKAYCRDFLALRYKDRALCTMYYEEPETTEEFLVASWECSGTETPTEFPSILDDEDRPKLSSSSKKRTPKKPVAASPPSVAASMEPNITLSLSVDSTHTLSPSSSFESSFRAQEFPLLSDSFNNKPLVSPPKHSFEPRRVYPPKLSQKQRKKLSSEFEEKLNLSREETKPKQSRGWAKIELPPDSPLELSRTPVSSSPSAEKTSDRGPKMVEIIAIEQQKRDNLRRMTTKPLHLTQMEEAAMQGLQEFYNVDSCFDERITVARVLPLNVAEPTWMPLSRRLPVL